MHPFSLFSFILPVVAAFPSQWAVPAMPHKRLLSRRGGGIMQARNGSMALIDKYEGNSFFDGFDFVVGPDPTHGLNDYVGKEEATSSGLAYIQNDGTAVIGADDKTVLPVGGRRKSIRLMSKKEWRGGLFVFDLAKGAVGCSVWPAMWTNGPNWPQGGEIDVYEGVNFLTQNHMTLHTRPGCSLDAKAAPFGGHTQAFTGQVVRTACDAKTNGCEVVDQDQSSFGAGVEKNGGAVYAMLWDSVGVRIFRFHTMPADLAKDAPNPIGWPAPVAFWSSAHCSMDEFFPDPHRIIINVALCGDWAGNVYSSSGCPGTCAEAVANPKNFVDAKMKLRSVRVYQWPTH